MNPKLSVVIPVYKVEDYLERCVRSVLDQDYRDLEVILVDDGSPDRCPQICDYLASQDPRVIVIHKKNGGLSSARNAGIDKAKGEYIAFLDSDDQWEVNILQSLMTIVQATSPQMLLFSSKCLYEGKGLYARDYHNFYDLKGKNIFPLDLYPMLIKYGDLHEHACTKLIKLELLKDNGLKFKEGILGEDTEWMFRLLRLDIAICLSDIQLYVYTENRFGSIVNTASTRSVRDTISTIRSSIKFYNTNPTFPTKEYELAHCAYLWSIALGIYRNVAKQERQAMKGELIDLKGCLDLQAHPKSKKVEKLYSLLGFELSAWILSWYIQLHKRNIINRKKQIK